MIVTITMITKSNCQKNQVLRIFVSIGCTIASSWCILVILVSTKPTQRIFLSVTTNTTQQHLGQSIGENKIFSEFKPSLHLHIVCHSPISQYTYNKRTKSFQKMPLHNSKVQVNEQNQQQCYQCKQTFFLFSLFWQFFFYSSSLFFSSIATSIVLFRFSSSIE